MTSEAKNILMTGLPGCGKTTLITKLADELREYNPAGFFTGEIREHGIRKGFHFTSLDGKMTGVLAHVDIKGPHHVGKYGVDLEGFERFLGTLHLLDPPPGLVIIDEIGKMECLSPLFREIVSVLLNAPAPVVASIALKAGGFIDAVKHRRDVRLTEMSERNRDTLLPEIAGFVRSLRKTS